MASTKWIYPEGTFNVNQEVNIYCLPPKEICFPFTPNGLLVECGNEWNCNPKCVGDQIFFYEPHRTDVLQLQTQFYDSGRENPIGGTTVDICALDGTIIGQITDIAEEFDTYSCQTITIDFSLSVFDDLECFSFKINPPNAIEDSICTQQMRFTNNCNNSILIESKYDGTDCGNNKYGSGFSNKIRIPFTYKYFGVLPTIDVFNERLDNTNVRNYTRIIAENKISPYLMWYLGNIIFGSNEICLTDSDGNVTEYKVEDAGRFTPLSSGCMFANVQFEMYQECDNNHNC